MRIVLSFALSLLCTAPGFAADAPAVEGKRIFTRVGCYQCHGYAGQGGSAGLKLAPDPLPYDALSQFVRTTTGAMPAYSKTILSDADLQKIYAYLQSLPRSPSPDKLAPFRDLP